jgi:hypothetical protein
MGLFQKSVLTNYLTSVSDSDIDKGWNSLISYKEMDSKVQTFKEEVFQAKFLEKIFVDCFGYKSQYDSAEEGNLFFEQKNTSNSKKADGAIKKDGEVIAVIELKSTKTKNLDDVKNQAFGYYTNNSKCEYVITSNFNKLRFYIERNEDYLEFDLFNIDKEKFKLLWLCLDSKNLLEGKPKEIKNKSLINEENITKKLYQDYSTFRQELFNNLIENNQTIEKRVILNKTQKLLDRLLFILFSEDRGLLPANSISEIINHWEFGGDSLYSTFLTYFEIINKGRPKRGDKKGIYAYNGGLFSEDVVLNTLNISDDVLLSNAKKLTKYDFESDVSVDILGHIFEHSLSEIEELQNQIDGVETDKSKSKRKKDGVYYTPKYITKYIVDNTLGKLCDEKKIELDINEETYSPSAKRSRNRISALDDYRNWLLKLTICDPACGSGAFLIQVLNFLIKEHHYIDELSASYNKDSLVLSDVKNSILENNLYGVDINQESVEIAKLSLWLNTAESNRKLTSLNNNIKCGNSLIDDPLVAGDKAFNWKKEYPEIFANGGFDIVIGNPPYVLCQPSNTIESTLNYYKTFEVASYKIDLFHLFFEKSTSLLKSDGKLGFITPNTYLNNKYIKPLREYILLNTKIDILINYKDKVFIDAGVDVATIILTKNQTKNDIIQLFESENSVLKSLGNKSQGKWIEEVDNIFNLNKTFEIKFENCVNLKDVCSSYFGIQAYDRKSTVSDVKENENYLPIIDGGDINKFSYATPNKYLNYLPEKIKSGGNYDVYSEKRIVISQIGLTPIVGLCESNILASNTLYNINLKDRTYSLNYLLCILNSKLLKSYWISKYSDGKKLFPKIKGFQLKELPIKVADKQTQEPLIEKAEQMLSLNKNLLEVSDKFQRTLQRNLKIETLPKKFQNWYLLSYNEFLKELSKKKVKLSLEDEGRLEDFFISESKKALEIKDSIDKTDKEIDQMVYKLYGLTKEEIEIVENS